MSGKNLKIDGKVCPNVTVIKALDTDQNKLVEFVDTSDANATSSDIITGKTAYVDGKKVIGEATAGIDTSDATAIAADIRLGKTAYAKDAKLTGTIEDYAGSTPIQLTDQNGVNLNTKGKYCPEDITVVPQLQEKTVTPSETQQTATPDANYAGLSKVIVGAVQTKEVTVTPAKGQQVLEVTDNKYYKKVTVEAIPADYVIPSGTIQITENGVVDVSGKANANVNVPTGVDTNDATAGSGDILQGKTAYAKGVKLTGSVLTYDGAFVGNTHTITATLTNVTAASGNATTIAVGETKVLTYTAADGYALPDTVTVTGATGVWDKDAGTLTLSNPTGDVAFTIAGVEAAPTLQYYGTGTDLSQGRGELAATTVGNYALFGGGRAGANTSDVTTRVDAYDTNLTRTTPTALSKARGGLKATTIGNYALFGGGSDGSNKALTTVDAYNTTLTRTIPTAFSTAKKGGFDATHIGDYALFGGGYDASNKEQTTIDVYDANLTRITPIELSDARTGLAATNVGNYALFGGGVYDYFSKKAVVDAYDTNLTRTTPTALSKARSGLNATTVGNYALFSGGDAGAVVDAYDTSLTRIIPDALSDARRLLATTNINNYALFGGGILSNSSAVVDAYDTNLTKTIPTPLSAARYELAATSVGKYAIFAGGSAKFATVDVYTVA